MYGIDAYDPFGRLDLQFLKDVTLMVGQFRVLQDPMFFVRKRY